MEMRKHIYILSRIPTFSSGQIQYNNLMLKGSHPLGNLGVIGVRQI